MEKGLSIRNETLQVSDLRVIHCRIIDFSDDAIPQGEPNSARSCIRCPHAVFVAVSPSGLDARSPDSRRSTGSGSSSAENPARRRERGPPQPFEGKDASFTGTLRQLRAA